MRIFFVLTLLGVGLTLGARAENVFQASLLTSGGTAQINFGRIYFRADGDQVDFLAVIFPFGNLPMDLDPVLSVPGASLSFDLGPATQEWLRGTRTVADHNPFLPAPPWLPHSYDENGNPLYLDSPVIREANLYTGRFELPADFADDLLAGLGRIDFNSMLGGEIRVVAVPEPTAGALLLVGGLVWRRWRSQK